MHVQAGWYIVNWTHVTQVMDTCRDHVNTVGKLGPCLTIRQFVPKEGQFFVKLVLYDRKMWSLELREGCR
jgi:hypothetical protein